MAAFLGLAPLPAKIQADIIPVVRNHTIPTERAATDGFQLPIWAIVTFGAFLLFKLGWGVLMFNDVPQAHEELMREIQEARADLQKKGVEVGED